MRLLLVACVNCLNPRRSSAQPCVPPPTGFLHEKSEMARRYTSVTKPRVCPAIETTDSWGRLFRALEGNCILDVTRKHTGHAGRSNVMKTDPNTGEGIALGSIRTPETAVRPVDTTLRRHPGRPVPDRRDNRRPETPRHTTRLRMRATQPPCLGGRNAGHSGRRSRKHGPVPHRGACHERCGKLSQAPPPMITSNTIRAGQSVFPAAPA